MDYEGTEPRNHFDISYYRSVKQNPYVKCKTILLMVATKSRKTMLINAIVNHILGVVINLTNMLCEGLWPLFFIDYYFDI